MRGDNVTFVFGVKTILNHLADISPANSKRLVYVPAGPSVVLASWVMLGTTMVSAGIVNPTPSCGPDPKVERKEFSGALDVWMTNSHRGKSIQRR